MVAIFYLTETGDYLLGTAPNIKSITRRTLQAYNVEVLANFPPFWESIANEKPGL